MLVRSSILAQKLRPLAGFANILRRVLLSHHHRLLTSVLVLSACSAAPPSEDVTGTAGGTAGATAGTAGAAGTAGTATGTAGTAGAAGASACRPPAGVSGSPRTIEEAVTLLNALPKPTSVACFLESLDRPIEVFATSNIISAQPAFSPGSPRIFLRRDRLVLSVVPEGEASRLVEFSYLLEDSARSIKAELSMPLTEPVTRAAPYDRVIATERTGQPRAETVCRGCHAAEERVQNIDFAIAYSSVALRPNPNSQVSLEGLAQAQRACDPLAQPERCAILTGLFAHGPVVQAEFPSTMTIFN